MNFIMEAAKLARSSAPVLTKADFQEDDEILKGDQEFTCLATKLDEFIKRVDGKTFKKIFVNSCDLQKTKETSVYDIVNW